MTMRRKVLILLIALAAAGVAATVVCAPSAITKKEAADAKALHLAFRAMIESLAAQNPKFPLPPGYPESFPVQEPVATISEWNCLGPMLIRARVHMRYGEAGSVDEREIYYLWLPSRPIAIARYPAVDWLESCWGVGIGGVNLWDRWQFFPDVALWSRVNEMKTPR
jgi:hypothetical protein